MIRFTILGQLASKSNSRQHVGHGRNIKSKSALAFVDDFHAQCPRSVKVCLGSLAKPLLARVVVYYRDMKSDLDCALLYDCLQKAGVVQNDRYIRAKYEVARIDKKNPRVEIELEEMR